MTQTSPQGELAATERTTLHRRANRGSFDKAVIAAILDEAQVAHIAYVSGDAPVITPMAFVRLDDVLYFHGAPANATLKAMVKQEVCVQVMLLDGLVLAKSAFHHSVNYRSITAFGRAFLVRDMARKSQTLDLLLEKTLRGRAKNCRLPTEAELAATNVVGFALNEASAKIRVGDPISDPEDESFDAWAGVIPIHQRLGQPVAAPTNQRSAPALPLMQCDSADFQIVEKQVGAILLSTDKSKLQFDFVHSYLSEVSYWSRGISAEAQHAAMANSLCMGAYLGSAQIGFGRIITDHNSFGYLCDFFIDPAHQKQGLGGHFMRFMQNLPFSQKVRRFVLATRDAHAFYDGHDFGPLIEPELFMQWRRK